MIAGIDHLLSRGMIAGVNRVRTRGMIAGVNRVRTRGVIAGVNRVRTRGVIARINRVRTRGVIGNACKAPIFHLGWCGPKLTQFCRKRLAGPIGHVVEDAVRTAHQFAMLFAECHFRSPVRKFQIQSDSHFMDWPRLRL